MPPILGDWNVGQPLNTSHMLAIMDAMKGDITLTKPLRQIRLELRLTTREARIGDALNALGFARSYHRFEWREPLGADDEGPRYLDNICDHDLEDLLAAFKTAPARGEDPDTYDGKQHEDEWAAAVLKHTLAAIKKHVKVRSADMIDTLERLTTVKKDPAWEGGILPMRDRWFSEDAIGLGVTLVKEAQDSPNSKRLVNIENAHTTKNLVLTSTEDSSRTVTIKAGKKGGLTSNQMHDSSWTLSLVDP